MLIKRKKLSLASITGAKGGLFRNLKKSQPSTPLTSAHSAAISMGQLIKNICNIQQPNSLTQNYFYSFNNSKKYQYIKLINNANRILNYFFGTFYALISRPVYLFTQNKLVIFINYYSPKTSKRLSRRYVWKYNKQPSKSARILKQELKTLINTLSKFFNLKVELQLNRLKYPYQDSQILSKLLALGSNLNRFRSLMGLIIKKSLIITKDLKDDKKNNDFYNIVIKRRKVKIHKTVPTVLTGLKVRISGRLLTERVIPKKTVRQKEIGGFIRDKNSLVDYALYNSKNKRGSYSVKVWTTSKICI
jgi:hypothetical protein